MLLKWCGSLFISAEWRISHSRQQRYLDGVALLLSVCLLWQYLPEFLFIRLLLSGCIGFAIWKLLLFSRPNVSAVGYQLDGLVPRWWLLIDGKKQTITLADGSIRRRQLVVLRWSLWPWRRLMLRADSFASDDEFRRFKAALYGAI